ncbi:MAG: glycoside hydrolase family 25 protein [Ethanoligenens sp.]
MQQRKLIISAVILAIWLPFSAQAYAATPSDGTANISVVDLYHGDTVNDWMALRGQVQALYFKASEGTTFIDPKAATFAQNAQAVGLPFGFYHYLWPRGDAAYSAAQADYFYKQVRKYPYSCIPAVDVEESGGLTRTVVSANVRAFAEEFQRLSGQQVMIYSGRNFINTYLDRSLTTYRLWIAQYGVTEPGSNNVFAAYTMWQYTDSRRVTGISNKVDSNLATNGIFLGGSSGGGSSDGNVWDTDVYYLDTMPHPWNAVAGANFDVLNRNGSRVGNHQVEAGDHICILGVDFERQLAEVVYPLNTGGYAHGFIHNRQDLLHNRFYMQWKNGSTNEPVYNMSGTRIGTIFPYERATPLYRVGNGTMVLYNTAKGSETKSGVVYYSGKFSF